MDCVEPHFVIKLYVLPNQTSTTGIFRDQLNDLNIKNNLYSKHEPRLSDATRLQQNDNTFIYIGDQ